LQPASRVLVGHAASVTLPAREPVRLGLILVEVRAVHVVGVRVVDVKGRDGELVVDVVEGDVVIGEGVVV